MNQDQQYQAYSDEFYDAFTLCNDELADQKADALFNFLRKESLENPAGRPFTFTEYSTTSDIHTFLDAYQQRLQTNVDLSNSMEGKIFSNISNYCLDKKMDFHNPELSEKGFSINFKPIQIKAVIDWLDLSFEVNPSKCTFAYKPNARSLIKSFLTLKTGTRHYVKADESDIAQEHLTFTIRLHDIKHKNDVLKIAELLARQYGADLSQMKISNIELSLDFYHAPSKALLSALHKSLRYQATAGNFRIYKFVKEDIRNKFNPVPHAPSMLRKRFNSDWCLGVNPKGSPLCYRLYVKTTDSNKQPLPPKEHRLRVEVTLDQTILRDTNCSIESIQSIIKQGFKFLSFTELDKKASKAFKESYDEIIKPYGKEQKERNVNRNKRTLQDGIKTHEELNSIISKAVFNLCRKF